MPSLVWDEITYPLLNFNGAIVEVQEWISNFIPQFIMDVIKLNRVCKNGPRLKVYVYRMFLVELENIH